MDVPSELGKEKKKPHASQACAGCRKRKARCDAEQPCSTCRHYGSKCEYALEGDRRTAPSRPYVDALQNRIHTLEALFSRDAPELEDMQRSNEALQRRVLMLERGLAERGVSISSLVEAATLSATSERPPAAPPRVQPIDIRPSSAVGAKRSAPWEAEDDESGTDWIGQMDRLHLTDEGELYFFGPSSNIAHLDSASASASCRGPPSPAAPIGAPCFPKPPIEVDWSRNLPADLGISKETHDTILDLYEAWFAPWCLVTDMARFRHDMKVVLSQPKPLPQTPLASRPPTRTPFYSPLLHNAVLALGCFLYRGSQLPSFPPVNVNSTALAQAPFVPSFAPPSFLPSEAGSHPTYPELASKAFYNTAAALLEAEAELPMISTVRGLLCIASCNSASARPNVGYFYAGIALRIASTLGLNIDSTPYVSSGMITPEVKVARDRTFYTAFVQDVLWNISQGRSFTTFHSGDLNFGLPPVDTDEDLRPWKFPSVWTPSPDAKERFPLGPSWSSTCFHHTILLAKIADFMMTSIYALKTDRWSATLSELHLKLVEWEDNLPTALRVTQFGGIAPPPHILTLQITFGKICMLLHRPFYHRKEIGAELSAKLCDASALKTVKLLELYDTVYGIENSPLTSVQSAFVAATCLLLKVRRSQARAAKRARGALDGLLSCIRILRKMGRCWKWATSSAIILQGLCDRLLPTDCDPPTNKSVLGSPAEEDAQSGQGQLSSTLVPTTHNADWRTAEQLAEHPYDPTNPGLFEYAPGFRDYFLAPSSSGIITTSATEPTDPFAFGGVFGTDFGAISMTAPGLESYSFADLFL